MHFFSLPDEYGTGELVFEEKYSAHGHFDTNPARTIPPGKYTSFLHVKTTGAALGSKGYVRFRYNYRTPWDGPNFLDVTNFYCGWDTPWSGSNRAGAGAFDRDHSLTSSEKEDIMGGYITELRSR